MVPREISKHCVLDPENDGLFLQLGAKVADQGWQAVCWLDWFALTQLTKILHMLVDSSLTD
jgi:hypothetical protein